MVSWGYKEVNLVIESALYLLASAPTTAHRDSIFKQHAFRSPFQPIARRP